MRSERQEGIVILPKSPPSSIAGNIDIFDFTLTKEEMEPMRGVDTGKDGHAPETPGIGEMLLEKYKIHD